MVVDGLSNGTSYVFRVAAVNSSGVGTFSANSTAVVPRIVPTVPSSPLAVVGVAANAQVALNWTASSSNGGSSITDYTIQYSSNAGLSWSTFSRTASTATTATVTGLTNGTGYVFRVAAVNGVGNSSWSSNSLVVTPCTVPAAPNSLAGIAGNALVSLAWIAPSTNGGIAITDYNVQYSSDAGSSWSTVSHAASTATTATVTGLTNGTGYVFRVAAVNGVGAGSYTVQSSAVTPATTPGVPTNLSATAGNGQASLSWIAPAWNGGSPITDYAIQYSSNGGSTWSTFSHAVSTAVSATVTSLANGTSYVFRVAAVNGMGTGSYTAQSSAVVPAATPGVPSSLAATAGNSQASLSWSAPASSGGSAITDYSIQYSSNGGTSWITFSHTASAVVSTTVTGLANGTSYVFRVAAVNGVGTGSYTAQSSEVVPATTPDVPSSLSGTAGSGQVLLSWIAPGSDGGAPITDYAIQYSSNGGTNWSAFSHAASNAVSATVTGLANGTSYVFRVSAVNGVGNGSYTAQSSAIVPLATPGVPSSLVALAGDGSVALNWTAPADTGGNPITDYSIQYSSNGGFTWSIFTHAASASVSTTVTGFANGTSYVFRVAAVTGIGTGFYTAQSSAVVPATTPGVPLSLSGVAGNGQVSLGWVAPASNGGSPITDYAIQYSSNGGSTWSTSSHAASTAVSATVTGLANGTGYLFRVAAVNIAGTGDFSASSNSVLPDGLAPTVSMSSSKALLSLADTTIYTFTLSEPSTTFTASDVYPINGTVSSFTAVSSTVYTCTFTPRSDLTGTGYVVVYDNTFADLAGNGNKSANGYVIGFVNIDTVQPTTQISVGRVSLGASDTTTYTFTLSKPSNTFTSADIYPINGTVSSFNAVSSTVYTCTFTPRPDFTGTGYVVVYDNTFADLAGNGNKSANGYVISFVNIDTAPPTAQISSTKSGLLSGDSAIYTFNLSKPSTTFTASDVYPTNGAVSNFIALSSTVYTCTFTPKPDFTGTGYVVVYDNTFTDLAGNGNRSSNGYLISFVTIDTVVPPTVLIAPDKNTLKAGDTTTYTFTLSKPSSTFTASDIYPTNGTVSGFTALSSTVYNCTFTPKASFTGAGYVVVYDSTFTDSTGHGNKSPNGYVISTLAIDTVVLLNPTLTITSNMPNLKAAETATYTFTLSKPSTNFTASDVQVLYGTLSGFTKVNSTVYTAKFTPNLRTTNTGYVRVNDGTFTDTVGNANKNPNGGGTVISYVSIDTARKR